MSNNFKNRYKKEYILLFDDIINIKNIDTNKIRIDKKSYKNVLRHTKSIWRTVNQNRMLY